MEHFTNFLSLNSKEFNVPLYKRLQDSPHEITTRARFMIKMCVWGDFMAPDTEKVIAKTTNECIFKALRFIRKNHPNLVKRALNQIAKKKWEPCHTCSNGITKEWHLIELCFPRLTVE